MRTFQITVYVQMRITNTIVALDQDVALKKVQKKLKGKRIKLKREHFEDYPTVIELNAEKTATL